MDDFNDRAARVNALVMPDTNMSGAAFAVWLRKEQDKCLHPETKEEVWEKNFSDGKYRCSFRFTKCTRCGKRLKCS